MSDENAIDMLVKHHRELEGLLEEVMKAEGPARGPGFERAADLLATHVTLEEKHFYPAVQASRTEDILLESLEEHLSLKRVLADLLGLSPEDERFEPKLHVLKEQVEHHHKEEEDKLFPKVRKLLDEARLAALGGEMQGAMRAIEARGAPRRIVLGQTEEAAALP